MTALSQKIVTTNEFFKLKLWYAKSFIETFKHVQKVYNKSI